MRGFLYAVLFVLPVCVYAQRQNDVWYFGEGAGVSFATGGPVAIVGPLSTQEGTASVCDPITGALLFTTDGVKVYDANLVEMANGNGLQGGYSSTQSALIIPRPGAQGSYYIFTAGDLSNGDPTNPGLHYSVVDMWQNGGLGDVVTRNTRLLDSCAEKLHATPHCDGESYWVVAHHMTLPRFYMYKVTRDGIEPPVESNVGMQYVTDSVAVGDNYGLGMVKFSASGKRLALANPYARRCEVFDVDLQRGVISNPRLVDSALAFYGLSFSPSEELLYVTSWSEVYQYALSSSPIRASRFDLRAIPSFSNSSWKGGIQRGPDGAIYVADGTQLQRIPFPDVIGPGCGYLSQQLILERPTRTLIGLPNIIDGQYLTTRIAECKPPVAHFACDSMACIPSCVTFVNSSIKNDETWTWSFAGGTPSTYTGRTPPPVCFANEGFSLVRLIATNAFGSDTMQYTLRIGKRPELSAGADFTFCSAETKQLRATGAVRYQWQPAWAVSDPFIADPIVTTRSRTEFILYGWSVDGCGSIDTVVGEYLDPAPLVLNSISCNVADIVTFVIEKVPGDFDSADVSFQYLGTSLTDVSVGIGTELGRAALSDGTTVLHMRLRGREADNIVGSVRGKAMLHPLRYSSLSCNVDASYGCREVSGTTAELEISGCALRMRNIILATNTMLRRSLYNSNGVLVSTDDVQYDKWEEEPDLGPTLPAGLYIEVLSLYGEPLHRRTFTVGFH